MMIWQIRERHERLHQQYREEQRRDKKYQQDLETIRALKEIGYHEEVAMTVVQRAEVFAKRAHGNQKRKYTGEPYHVHLEEVAGLVRDAGLDVHVQAAAWLHDVLEDTHIQEHDLRAEFGDLITELVLEVTDVSRPHHGNRVTRKALDRDHLSRASYEGQSIKLADLISNTGSITQHDPNFARVYLHEKRALLEAMTGGHAVLRTRAVELSVKNGGL